MKLSPTTITRPAVSQRLWLCSCLSIPAIVLLSSYMHSIHLSEIMCQLVKPSAVLGHYTPALNSVHDNAMSVPGFQLTAILPVTQESLDYLIRLLMPFSGLSQLREVIILCPQSIVPKARLILASIVSSYPMASYPHITLETPSNSLYSPIDTIKTASQVSTEWVLLMDHHGLSQLPGSSHNTLLNPSAISGPYGPQGICHTWSNIPQLCALGPDEHFKAALYLLPPLVTPTYLAMSFRSSEWIDPWASFGRHIAAIYGDGSGGLVIDTSRAMLLNSLRPVTTIISDYGHNVSSQNDTHEIGLEVTRDFVDFRNSGVFIILVPTGEDLRAMSALLCRLQSRGSTVRAFIYDDSEILSSDEVLRHYRTRNCNLTYISITSPRMLRLQKLNSWLNRISPVNVIIACFRDEAFSSVLDNLVTGIHNGSVLVRLSHEDLPYSEWMGSLSLAEWHNWNVPSLDISIVTKDRPKSLARLIKSISAGHFFGDIVDLRVNLEQSCDVETMNIVESLSWSRGAMFVHRRIIHGGLLPAVVESWYPRSNDTYGLLLEDDVELSPLFYAWAKMTLLRYRYGDAENRSPSMFGISLYQQKIVELSPEGRHPFDVPALFSSRKLPDIYTPYLSPVPCSWGAIYFPEHWREFHSYLSIRLSEYSMRIGTTIVPDVRSNKWSKSWKKYFIEMAYLRGYVMLYPNYPDFVSLSTNHLEVGSHVKSRTTEKQNLFMVPLMQLPVSSEMNGLLELPNCTLPAWSELPVLNLTGAITTLTALVEAGNSRRSELTGSTAVLAPFDAADLMGLRKERAFCCP